MLELFNAPLAMFEYFVLIFMRVFGVFTIVPVLGSRVIPYQVRIIFALMTSLALFPTLNVPFKEGVSFLALMGYSAYEFVYGLVIGFFVLLLFFCVQLAGQIAGYQMGLAIANVFDPVSSQSDSIIGNGMYWLYITVFFVTRMHYVLFNGIYDSFQSLPLARGFHFGKDMVEGMNIVFANFIAISLKIGAPLILTLLILMVCLGIVTRLIPQLNVFIVGLPLQIALGLIMFAALIPLLVEIGDILMRDYLTLFMRFILTGG